jgi:hypothetical protein
MKANKVLGALLALSLGFAPMVGAEDVYAQGQAAQNKDKGTASTAKGKGKAKKASTQAAVSTNPLDAPMTTKPIAWEPTGLTWGLSHKEVALAIDAQLEADYKPLFQKVQPGVKMKALEAALSEDKATFRRSKIEFGKLPTGVDSTPLKGEYTYRNQEMMMTLLRKGRTREFFYIQNKLWKFIDEVQLGDGTFYGKTFQDAVVKLSSVLGVPGRLLNPDPTQNRYATEVDWKDATTHLRAIERNDTSFAIAYEELATVANLPELRKYKPPIENAVDPSVADAMRKSEEAPGPPKAAAGTKPAAAGTKPKK